MAIAITGHCWDLEGFENLQVERSYGKRNISYFYDRNFVVSVRK